MPSAHDHGGFSWSVGTVPTDESLALSGTSAEVPAALTLVAHWGASVLGPAVVACPDGVRLRLVAAERGTGLVGVKVRVAAPHDHLLDGVPGPVD